MTRLLILLAALNVLHTASADELRFDNKAAWQDWQMPHGLIEFTADGQLGLVKYRKEIDAVQNAHLYSHPTQQRGENVSGGIWATGSNAAAAARIIDGDPQSYWQPDMADPLKDWFIDIDLGRAVLARQIVLRFPDEEGARPLRQFTVYATTGARILATQDVFKYEPVYRTSKPNTATEVVIPLEYAAQDTVIAVDPGMNLDLAYENRYQVIQYLSIVAEEQHADAALAEVEVLTVGDNISIGTKERGFFQNGTVAVQPVNLFDADINTKALITSGRGDQGWEAAGTWFYVDLGAVFFVDELFLYVLRQFEGTSGSHRGSAGSGHRILYSDGRRSTRSSLPGPEPFDYSELLTHENPRDQDLYRIRYKFKKRSMRHLFWHGLSDQGWLESRWAEFMLFSPGYPAQVTLRSDFIDLATTSGDGRPKVIRHLSWRADLPTGTRLQLRSRSGNQLQNVYTFYDRKGEAVTEEKWLSSPKVLRGNVDSTLATGEDWDSWSNEYQASEEPFQSASPRRYVQLEMILSTNDPEVAPTVQALSIEFEDALLQGANGSIAPRRARPNEETRFTYTLWPQADADDNGFDLLRFILPATASDVSLSVGGQATAPASIQQEGDSLFVALPNTIALDSVEVVFTTRVVENATLFTLDLGTSERPGLWQSVEAATRRANIVMLPELIGSSELIGNLSIDSPIITPNGDGTNDRVQISFVAYKVIDSTPRVQIHDLSGQLIAELLPSALDGADHTYTWAGRNLHGAIVPPGIYLCSIDLGADAGKDTALRTIAVAY